MADAEDTTPKETAEAEQSYQYGPILAYPYDQDRLPGIAVFRTVDMEEPPNFLFTEGGPNITLPLPGGLVYTDGASYENADLGFIGSSLMDGEFTDKVKSIGDNLNASSAGSLATDLLSKVTGNRTRAALGKTPNPNTRALFKQVNLRTFQFNYKFTPVSPEEAESVKEIIKSFRKELYPASTNKKEGDFEIAYKFPNRFDIKFYLGSTENGRYMVEPKLQPAYLTSMTTTYNSNAILSTPGKSSMDFAEVDISMTFLESKTLFDRDVTKGF